MNTFEKVKEILVKQLNVAVDVIKPESEIIKDLCADSLDVVEMLMTLEDEFGITISEEEAVKIVTVGDIIKLIDKE